MWRFLAVFSLDTPRKCGDIYYMEFEWDPRKAAKNLHKHGISFTEAATVFADPLSATMGDPDHSRDEERRIIVGWSDQRRLLMVSHPSVAIEFASSVRAG
jgi:uncharacterized protein